MGGGGREGNMTKDRSEKLSFLEARDPAEMQIRIRSLGNVRVLQGVLHKGGPSVLWEYRQWEGFMTLRCT